MYYFSTFHINAMTRSRISYKNRSIRKKNRKIVCQQKRVSEHAINSVITFKWHPLFENIHLQKTLRASTMIFLYPWWDSIIAATITCPDEYYQRYSVTTLSRGVSQEHLFHNWRHAMTSRQCTSAPYRAHLKGTDSDFGDSASTVCTFDMISSLLSPQS